MKHFYSFLTLLFALIPFGVSAQTMVNFIIDIDNASSATVTANYQTLKLVSGQNNVSVPEYGTVQIQEKDGYKITVTDFNGYTASMYGGSVYFYPEATNNGKTIKITSRQIVNDATVTVVVDDPSKVRAKIVGQNNYLTMQAGANTVPYCSTYHTEMEIEDNDQALYSVTADGQPAPYYSGSHHIALPDARFVEIKANYPDVDCQVKFNFVNPGTKGFISGVRVGYDEVAPEVFLSDNFTVKAGKQVAFYANDTQSYNVNSVKINGQYTSFYGSSNFIAKGNTTIDIDVTKIEQVQATVNVYGPAAGLKAQMYYQDITLADGANTLSFFSNQNAFSVNAAQGYVIESYTVNGTDWLNNGNAYLNAGDVVNITVKAKEYNNRVIVYTNADVTSWPYFIFQSIPTRESYPIVQGYNTVNFADGEAPFSAGFYNPASSNNWYFINNEAVALEGYQYSFNVVNGDVIKLFYGETEPVLHDVVLEMPEGTGATVTYDMVKTLAAAGTTQHFDGTLFEVTPNAGTELHVKVNGELVAAANGKHSFTVNGPATVEVKNANGTSGIESIDAAATVAPVYNLQGMKVAESTQFNQLPAGLYIVNGKKVVKN